MTDNRLNAFQALVDNLRSEGQTSRAECVEELVAEVRRLQAITANISDNLQGWQSLRGDQRDFKLKIIEALVEPQNTKGD